MSYNLFIDSDDDVAASNASSSDTVEYGQPCSQVRVLQRRLQSAWGGNRRSNSFSMSKQNNPHPRFSLESNSLPSSPDRLKSIVSQFSFAKIRNSALNISESEERLNDYFFEPKQPVLVAKMNRWVFSFLFCQPESLNEITRAGRKCTARTIPSEISGFDNSVLTEKMMSVKARDYERRLLHLIWDAQYFVMLFVICSDESCDLHVAPRRKQFVAFCILHCYSPTSAQSRIQDWVWALRMDFLSSSFSIASHNGL